MKKQKVLLAKSIYYGFRFKSFKYEDMNAMIIRNDGRAIVGILLRMYTAMGGTPSKALASQLKLIMKRISFLARTQGVPGVVLYLKTASVSLQQYLGGHYVPASQKCRITRTKSGIPTLFPAPIRGRIRQDHLPTIRLCLTICSLYRDLVFEGPIKLESITKPFDGVETIFGELGKYIPLFTQLIVRISRLKTSPRELLKGKFKYFPIDKSSPQVGSLSVSSTHPLVLVKSFLALSADLKLFNCYKILASLFTSPDLGKYYQLSGLIRILYKALRCAEFLTIQPLRGCFIGKLGLKVEAAGKMRIFAMVDPWTQWVLAPFHKVIFLILGKLPMDGTFSQLRPLSRGWRSENTPKFSMDLSSATDRLPIRLQCQLIGKLFDLSLLEQDAWREILVGRPYALPLSVRQRMKDAPESVTYSVGQPMGAYSSWAMLAYTHHFIVQCAAWICGEVNPNKLFMDYAVLGDDLVIFNAKVAKSYLRIITALGVECNPNKSILSPKGTALEFAKKTFYKGSDVSPVPVKEYHSALFTIPGLVEFGRKYRLSFPQIVKVAGFGYKVLGGINKPIWKQNRKLAYLYFAISVIDPESFLKSFRSMIHAKDNRFILGYIRWILTWVATTHQQVTDDLGWLSEFRPHKIIKEYGYKLKLYELVYNPHLEKLIKVRENIIPHLDLKFQELSDFKKYDIQYYLDRGLPIEGNFPLLLKETSHLIWSSMVMYKETVKLPISMLTLNRSRSIANAMKESKGIPGLFHMHETFRELIQRKELPPQFREAGLNPLILFRTLIRSKVFLNFTNSLKARHLLNLLLKRKLIFVSKATLWTIFLSSILGGILGPAKFTAVLGIIFSFTTEGSNASEWYLAVPCLIIQKLVLLVVSLSTLNVLYDPALLLDILTLFGNPELGWYEVGYQMTDLLIEAFKERFQEITDTLSVSIRHAHPLQDFCLGMGLTWIVIFLIRLITGL